MKSIYETMVSAYKGTQQTFWKETEESINKYVKSHNLNEEARLELSNVVCIRDPKGQYFLDEHKYEPIELEIEDFIVVEDSLPSSTMQIIFKDSECICFLDLEQ